MPSSDVLSAHAVVDGEQVTLRLNQLIGDTPVMQGGEVYEYLTSTMLHAQLESLGRFGILNLKYQQNWITFSFLPGMDALDAIEKVMLIVAQAHDKTPFVYLSA